MKKKKLEKIVSLVILLVFLLVILITAFVIYIERGQRKIPVNYARKMQILTVGEQRSRYSKTPKRKQQSIFKKGKESIRKGRKT